MSASATQGGRNDELSSARVIICCWLFL